ncbi:hypothetical protein [Pedobacter nutrimenti]|uniref:Uncharacterized protein n=1 Tax=Pedobacter nutrimenti TaxID=1241337 RepID=A0A318U8Z8_9SPHI|nr:hypothetical protein [Pedobacter nutrimenti]PYF68489.1 hypothetical protein B0O44_11276 [Pedobacter nutrimenti]
MKLYQIPVGSFFVIDGDKQLYKMLFNQPDGVSYYPCGISGQRIGDDIDIVFDNILFNSQCSPAAPIFQ